MKIQYQDKVAIDLDPSVPEINKVTDKNMNEIKQVVNHNADDLSTTAETVENFVNDVDNRLGTVESTTVNIVERMEIAEADISHIEDTTYTKTETDSLLDDLETSLENDISNEATYRENADTNLQNQIDAIVASSDVVDIVGTYQELQNYDTSHLGNNDIIKVLNDSTHNNAISYYRWKKQSNIWQYIGSEGPYYTKGETDNLLNGKVNKEAGKGLSQNDFTNALKNKLDGIEAGAQVNTVTGVKGNSESSYRTGNINITKANIGLGNVDNTSDVNKPVSNATTTELNKKINKTSIVTTLSSASTNTQIVGAKTVYDELQLKENLSNKVTEVDDSDIHYPTTSAVKKVENSLINEDNYQKLLINSLFQIAPKTDYGEGTDITLENTLPFYLDFENNIIGYGDMSQISTHGYQLWGGFTYERTSNGITHTYNLDGSITVKGIATADSFSITASIAVTQGIYKTLPAGTYVISGATETVSVQIIDTSGNTIANTSSNTTFTLNEETSVIIRAVVTNGTNIEDGVNLKVMLEAGGTVHDFEQYTGGIPAPSPNYPFPEKIVTGTQIIEILDGDDNLITTKTLSLGNNFLGKIGSGIDNINRNNNKFYKYKKIEKMVINENSSINIATSMTVDNTYIFSVEIPLENYSTDYLCSHFTVNTATSSSATIGSYVYNGTLRMRVPGSIATTVSEFKNWLSSHNVIVYYVLLTGTDIEITDTTLKGQLEEIYKLLSVNGTTKIKITGDLPMPMKVRGLKNLSINSIDDRLSLVEE